MATDNTLLQLANRALSIGARPDDGIQRVRLIRQINGLSIFYVLVASSAAVIFVAISGPLILIIVQVVATVWYASALVVNRAGRNGLAAHFTIVGFEVHLFIVMLYTNGWHSAALPIIILYPLLATLVEVTIIGHLAISLAQGATLFCLHTFLPASESYFAAVSNLTPLANDVLSIMGATYIPVMAAAIIGIIFKENIRAREQQKMLVKQISMDKTKLEYYANELRGETQRLRAEINVAHRIQTMMLPTQEEISAVDELDMACLMLPADEVGGDYYDVIKAGDVVTIGIGDVTGHGLVSGLVMLMAQTAIRTVAEGKTADHAELLNTVNRTLVANIRRIREERSMTLMVLTYHQRSFLISGQHESIILCRRDGAVEVIDTGSLGFYLGMVDPLPAKVKGIELTLKPDDVMLLYSDGVSEAVNDLGEQFGIERIAGTLRRFHRLPAERIKSRFMRELFNFVGNREVYDDISLMIIKQRGARAGEGERAWKQ
jgi:serine phosphatase RsbU (regulator of sigma subunit)